MHDSPATAAPAHQTARRYGPSQTSPDLRSVSTTHGGANLLLVGPAFSAIDYGRASETGAYSSPRVEFPLSIILFTSRAKPTSSSWEGLHSFPSFYIYRVLHDRRHPKALEQAGIHTDGAPIVARHDRAAALVDELVLLDATPPHLLLDEGTTRTAVHTDLADLAELVNAVVDGLVVGHRRVGGDDGQSGSGAKMRREQLSVGAQLPQTSSHEHGDVRGAVVIRAMHLGVIPELPDMVGEVE